MEENFMSTDYTIYYGADKFDVALKKIPHFTTFPEMMPWIGSEYTNQDIKVLVIGESHYFSKGTELHHDPKIWYSRTFTESLEAKHGHRVRYQISRNINNRFIKKTHSMHKNIHRELIKTNYFKDNTTRNSTPFDSIAYMNYFQRPANKNGSSISVKPQDIEVALETIKKVIITINPEVVLFASVKAYKTAIQSNLFSKLDVLHDYSAHPCSMHWNKPCIKYGKLQGEHYGSIPGKERFVRAIDKMTALSSSIYERT